MIRSTRPGFLALLSALGHRLDRPRPERRSARAGSEQLSKILSDPDKLEELKKERQRPPIEFFRSQVMPNDILPYIKGQSLVRWSAWR